MVCANEPPCAAVLVASANEPPCAALVASSKASERVPVVAKGSPDSGTSSSSSSSSSSDSTCVACKQRKLVLKGLRKKVSAAHRSNCPNKKESGWWRAALCLKALGCAEVLLFFVAY